MHSHWAHLIIFDALQGQLIAVNPEGIPYKGDALLFHLLESL
jgi:hypothetical protein